MAKRLIRLYCDIIKLIELLFKLMQLFKQFPLFGAFSKPFWEVIFVQNAVSKQLLTKRAAEELQML